MPCCASMAAEQLTRKRYSYDSYVPNAHAEQLQQYDQVFIM
jgi:hypothetical protein